MAAKAAKKEAAKKAAKEAKKAAAKKAAKEAKKAAAQAAAAEAAQAAEAAAQAAEAAAQAAAKAALAAAEADDSEVGAAAGWTVSAASGAGRAAGWTVSAASAVGRAAGWPQHMCRASEPSECRTRSLRWVNVCLAVQGGLAVQGCWLRGACVCRCHCLRPWWCRPRMRGRRRPPLAARRSLHASR